MVAHHFKEGYWEPMLNVIPNILTICFGEWTGSVTTWHTLKTGTGEPLEPPSSGSSGLRMRMVYLIPAQRLVYQALGRCLKPFTGLKSACQKVPDPLLTKATLTWPCSLASFWTMTSHSLHKQVFKKWGENYMVTSAEFECCDQAFLDKDQALPLSQQRCFNIPINSFSGFQPAPSCFSFTR